MESDAGSAATVLKPEGRDTRWAEHRITRRHELIEAALRAIHRHGAGVGMNEIAAVAGTTKSVLYRYFDDRSALHDAVAEQVEQNILGRVTAAVAESLNNEHPVSGLEVIETIIDVYLEMIESEPEIYRFVSTTSSARHTSDPHGPGSWSAVGRLQQIWVSLVPGLPADVAHVWGAAYIGMVRAAADDWLERGASSSTSRAELTALLADLVWTGMGPHWRTPVRPE